MAKKHKHRTKKGSKSATRRRKNPFMKHRRTSRRRRNPGMLTGATGILKSGFYALLGLVVARQLPQMVLGVNNSSWFGYIANLVATFLAAMVGGRFLGQDAGRDIAIGGGVYTVNRVIQDNFSPVGKVLSISGLGDYSALGDIQPGYFPLPVPTDANGNPIIPSELRQVAPAMAKTGMGSVASPTRFMSRF